MKSLEIKEQIQQILNKHLIDAFAYCSAQPFMALDDLYHRRLEQGYVCAIEERSNLEEMVDPTRLLAEAKSFLVILLPHSPYKYNGQVGFGRLATGTATEDYHLVMTRILQEVQEGLDAKGIPSKIIVDTSPLSDRAIAQRSGLGIIRRNNMFYHQKYGSYVHIGALLMAIDMPYKDHEPVSDPCGHCRRCVGHCPGQAILGDGTINSNKCVSYLTQKKELTSEEGTIIHDMVYGCNVCQEVCPANKGVKDIALPHLIDPNVDLAALLKISNKAFKESYSRTASGWRGKRTLQRNAIIVLGNQGDESHLPLLEAMLLDPRPVISERAAEAIKKIMKRINTDK